MPTFEEVWARIVSNAGANNQPIISTKGLPATYEMNGPTTVCVIRNGTEWKIPKGHFLQAYNLGLPLENTVPLQHLMGPSWIWAIFNDDRINQGEW